VLPVTQSQGIILRISAMGPEPPAAPAACYNLGFLCNATGVAKSAEPSMSDSSVRILLIGADVGLCDRLREIFAQIQGRTLTLECVGSLHKATGALSRQEHEIYFVALNGSQDAAGTILQQASANDWAKPIIFLVEDMTPPSRTQLIKAGAAGCLPRDQLNRPLL